MIRMTLCPFYCRSMVIYLILLSCISLLMSEAQAVPTANLMSEWSVLKGKEELNKPISLEAKRTKLSDLLEQVGRQTDIQLSLSLELLQANKLITIYVDKMELYDFMTAIARTYTANWICKSDKHYELSLRNSDELTLMLSRIGMPLFYRYREKGKTGLIELEERRHTIYNQILGELGKDSLNQRQGVPVTILSEEILAKLRNEYERMFALSFLQSTQQFTSALSSDLILRISASQKEGTLSWPQGELPEGRVRPELPNQVYFTIEFLDGNKKNLSVPIPIKWTLNQKNLEINPE